MTIELISIIALAGLIIALFRWLKQDIRDSNNRIDKLSNEIKEQGHILGEIRERLSRLEGLIEACSDLSQLYLHRTIPTNRTARPEKGTALKFLQ